MLKTALVSTCFGGCGAAVFTKGDQLVEALKRLRDRSKKKESDSNQISSKETSSSRSSGADKDSWSKMFARFDNLEKASAVELTLKQVPILLVHMHCDKSEWSVLKASGSWRNMTGISAASGSHFLEHLQPIAVSPDCPDLLLGLYGNLVRDGKAFTVRAIACAPGRKTFNCHCCPADQPLEPDVALIVGTDEEVQSSRKHKKTSSQTPALSRLYLVVLEEKLPNGHSSSGMMTPQLPLSIGRRPPKPSKVSQSHMHDSNCSFDSGSALQSVRSSSSEDEQPAKRVTNKGMNSEALRKMRGPSAPFKDVKLMQLIGKGAFARVYLGLWIAQPVAVKVLPWTRTENKLARPVFEGALAAELSHPNLVQTFQHSTTVIQEDQHILIDTTTLEEVTQRTDWEEFETWIVQEWCDMGTLTKHCDVHCPMQDGGGIEEAYSICIDIALALTYMHSRSIIHGDLTSNNVLLTSRIYAKKGYICKVSDFGLSRILEDENESITTDQLGTVTHMPPELLRLGQCKLSASADVYAFGVLMWQVYSGQIPFADLTKAQVIIQVAMGQQIKMPEDAPDSYRSIFQRCIAAADERPSAEEICLTIQEMLERESKESNPVREVLQQGGEDLPEEPQKHKPARKKKMKSTDKNSSSG